MRTRSALLAVAAGATVLLTGCGTAQEACNGVDLDSKAKTAAQAATAEGFEVEIEVEYDGGTAECVWDNSEDRLVGASED